MAKYTIEIEVDEFQEKELKRRAKLKEIAPDIMLSDIVNVSAHDILEEMVNDELNRKLTKIPAGRALSFLEVMDM